MNQEGTSLWCTLFVIQIIEGREPFCKLFVAEGDTLPINRLAQGVRMARIASESKGGFYATPEKEMRLVASRLRVEGAGEINLYDPCCGKGVALRILADAITTPECKAITYGVELEKERAVDSSQILDHVLQDGYENVRTEDKFSAIYLNPPYDNGFAERVETSFLRRLTNQSTNVLLKGALLMFCVPQYVLDDAALLIASRFTNVKVYRFTDENYPVFKQVVCSGTFNVQIQTREGIQRNSFVT